METTSSGNAMTEIALALAMAFFSIMVLTMISMGTTGENVPNSIGIILSPAAGGVKAAKLKPQTDCLTSAPMEQISGIA